jgi:outer membrane protein assembly factor BamA
MTLFSLITLLGLASQPTDSTAKVVVQQIIITGNYRTRERIIKREIALRIGDTLNLSSLENQIELDRRKVLNTNLFVMVEFRKKIISSTASLSQVALEIVVKEQWYLLAFPVFQLADRNFNEWWYERGRDLNRVIYGGYVSYQNLTGNNDKLRLLAEFGFVPRYEISYQIPYIDKKQRIGLTAGLSYVTNKTLAYQTKNDKLVFINSEKTTRTQLVPFVTLTHRPQFYGFHSLDLRYSKTSITDTIQAINPQYLADKNLNQNFFQITYKYYYDRRDRGQYPLKGFAYTFQVSRTGVLPTDDWQQWELSASGVKYWPLSKRWFASVSGRAKVSFADRQPFSIIQGLGYSGDLVRGYELYVIDGQDFGYIRNNLRYELLNKIFSLKFIKIRQFNTFPLAIYPNIYLDAGYVNNPFSALNQSKLANRPLVGVGAGLDFVTWYNFVFKLNYSINHLGEARPYFSIGRDY